MDAKTFNGAPGEVYGDGSKDEGGRASLIKFECADCGWIGVSAIVAREHVDAYQHRVVHFHSRQPFQAEQTAKRSA